MTEPTDAELDELRQANGGKLNFVTFSEFRTIARAVLAKWGSQPAVVGEQVGWTWQHDETGRTGFVDCWQVENGWQDGNPRLRLISKLYTTPQPTQAQVWAVPLTDREIELIDGMIQVQLDHASRCDAIANRAMADKQKGWDMERVALLQKFKAHGIKGGQHGADI